MTDFAFLHGGGQGSWVWSDAIAAVQAQSAGSVRCLALDVPGCGTKRERDTADIAPDDIVRELVADIEAAGMREVVLVGHSLAGAIVPGMAARAPSVFERLVYVSCTAMPEGVTLIQHRGTGVYGQSDHWIGWPLDPDTTEPADMQRAMFCNDMDDAAADRFIAKLGQDHWPQAIYAHDDWSYDHLERVPTTYIVCEQDMAVPVEWQERYARQLHVDRIVRIDAGHQVMNTQPDRLAEVLLAQSST